MDGRDVAEVGETCCAKQEIIEVLVARSPSLAGVDQTTPSLQRVVGGDIYGAAALLPC